MKLHAATLLAASVSLVILPGPIAAKPRSAAAALCNALALHVDAAAKDTKTPLFLRSYEPGPDEDRLPGPLATAAFSYDNALAIMALVSCGDVARARRIGDAFVYAVGNDRTFKDGRIRNAYRAGPIGSGAALLPGWWDNTRGAWSEDAYQHGTQTGNVAWVALALLSLDKVTSDPRYRKTARELSEWIRTNTLEASGFSGGVSGFDGEQTKLTWRSTEHNVDVGALGTWLERVAPGPAPEILTRNSRRFLDAMFDESAGMFRLGTLPDGTPQPTSKFALDALSWPLIGV